VHRFLLCSLAGGAEKALPCSVALVSLVLSVVTL
jgi:hypothetical protein